MKKRTSLARAVSPASEAAASYPRRAEVFDPSRRRFLRQVALGSAAAGCCGGAAAVGARRASAQGGVVDFSVLEEHDRVSAPAPMARQDPPSDDQAAGLSRVRATSSYVPPAAPEAVAVIEENRAMWLEPGYLVLVRWERPEGNESIVAAFEDARDEVGEYLAATVTDPQATLHHAGSLRPVEDGVTALLASRIAPARIVALHIDHDCQLVCGTPPEPELIPNVAGRIAPVRR